MKMILFVICLLFACENTNKTKSDKQEVDGKLAFQKGQIIGRFINLEEIIGDSIKINGKSLMVYTGFDCGSCVSKAFDLVNGVDSKKEESQFVVIEIQSNKGRDQINYNYANYIFSDPQDLLRKQLKYIKTPFAVRFDSEGKVSEVAFPDLATEIDDELIKVFSGVNN